MKVITNTLEPLVERWDDPGDYPNNVASGPLPSYDYLAGVEGEVILELDDKEMCEIVQVGLETFLESTEGIELPTGILSAKWQVDKVEGKQVTLSVTECESDPDYNPSERWDDDWDR